MATKREAKKIEQIRLAEKILFGIERVSIFLFVFFGGIPRFLYYSVGLFLFSNVYYASLAYERLFVVPRPNEPKSILFFVERYAIWFAGSYFFMEFPVYRFLAAVVFVMSNMYLVTKLLGINMTQMILNYITAGDEKEKDKEEEKEKVKQTMATLPEQQVQLNEKEGKTENNVDQPEVHSEMEVENSTLIKANIIEEDIVSNKEPQQHEKGKEQRDEEEREKKEEERIDGEQEEEDEDFDLNVNIDSGSDNFSVDDNDDDDDDEVSDISDDEDGQGGMRANDDSNEETMPEDGEKNVEVKEAESKADMEDSAAEISAADAITKEMKPSPNDFETESRKLIEERNMLIKKIHEICRENEEYLEEKVHKWEKERAFLKTEYQEQKKKLEGKYVELKEENRILHAKLRAESKITEQLNRNVLEYAEKCQRLEEEKAVLYERLDIEKAAAEFFKKCMHDLGVN